MKKAEKHTQAVLEELAQTLEQVAATLEAAKRVEETAQPAQEHGTQEVHRIMLRQQDMHHCIQARVQVLGLACDLIKETMHAAGVEERQAQILETAKRFGMFLEQGM